MNYETHREQLRFVIDNIIPLVNNEGWIVEAHIPGRDQAAELWG